MSQILKRELLVWAQYFAIAFIAEVAGFMGWLGAISREGDVFQLSNVFWVHELTRLHVWLPVFVILSGLRFGIVYFGYRAKPQVG